MAANKKLYDETLARLTGSLVGAPVPGVDVGGSPLPTPSPTPTPTPTAPALPLATPTAASSSSTKGLSVTGGDNQGWGYDAYINAGGNAAAGGTSSGSTTSSGTSSGSGYQSPYKALIDSALDKLLNRGPLDYDFNADPMYQQYKDRYMQQGELAMIDTMAQANAATGGYGSSYGQQVGQQTYQGYMTALNNMIPDLAGIALDKYNRETSDIYNQLGALQGQDASEYGRFNDDRAYQLQLQQLAQQNAQWAAEFAFEQQQYNDSLKGGSGSGSGGSGSNKTTTTNTKEASAAWNIIAQNAANGGAQQGRAAYNAAVAAGIIADTAENRAKMLYMEKTERVR